MDFFDVIKKYFISSAFSCDNFRFPIYPTSLFLGGVSPGKFSKCIYRNLALNSRIDFRANNRKKDTNATETVTNIFIKPEYRPGKKTKCVLLLYLLAAFLFGVFLVILDVVYYYLLLFFICCICW